MTTEFAEFFVPTNKVLIMTTSLSAKKIANPVTAMLIGEFLFSVFAEHVGEEHDYGGYSFDPTQGLELLQIIIKNCPY